MASSTGERLEVVEDGIEEIFELLPTCVRRRGFVSKSQAEFRQAEYSLRIALRSSAAHIRALVPLGGPHLHTRFEKRVKNGVTLDSVVEVSSLSDGGNTLETVADRGFKLSEHGAIFPVGELGLRNVAEPGLGKYEVVLCKLHVGRSWPVEDTQFTAESRPPTGYDSVFVFSGEPTDADAEGELFEGGSQLDAGEEALAASGVPSFLSPYPKEGLQYYQRYALFEDAQVLPMYYVLFEYDPLADDLKKVEDELNVARGMYETLKREDRLEDAISLREDIKTLESSVESARAGAKAGNASDAIRNTRMAADRVRAALQAKIGNERKLPRFFGHCHEHPAMALEFWDPVWGRALCVYCKMMGTYSHGEAANHRLIPIPQAYEQAINASRKEDPAVEQRRQAIIQYLHKIDERVEEVHKNSADVQEELYRRLQEAMLKLQARTQNKLSTLFGDEAELQRQLSQLDWMDSFLEYERGILPPLEFLNAWTAHSNARGDLLKRPTMARPNLEVQANLGVSGDLSITEDGQRVPGSPGRDAGPAGQNRLQGRQATGFQQGPVVGQGAGRSFNLGGSGMYNGLGAGGATATPFPGTPAFADGQRSPDFGAGVGLGGVATSRVPAQALWADGLRDT